MIRHANETIAIANEIADPSRAGTRARSARPVADPNQNRPCAGAEHDRDGERVERTEVEHAPVGARQRRDEGEHRRPPPS